MKQYIIFILFSLPLFAQEPIEQSIEKKITVEEPAITTLVLQIKEAKVEDRRVLMNQLKVRLRKMNKESRQKAMKELKNSFSKDRFSTGQKRYKHRKHKNLQHQQLNHQPKFRQLGNGQRRGRGQCNGHK